MMKDIVDSSVCPLLSKRFDHHSLERFDVIASSLPYPHLVVHVHTK
jgi:hypothetical protein